MKIVFALGMSSPLSMIVVASKISKRWGDEIEHHPLQLVLVHLAMCDADAGFGHDLPQLRGQKLDVFHAVVDEVDLTLRFNSRSTAGRINSSLKRATRVSTGSRSSGGVSRLEMSRAPMSPCAASAGSAWPSSSTRQPTAASFSASP